jgi:hypothetical protein
VTTIYLILQKKILIKKFINFRIVRIQILCPILVLEGYKKVIRKIDIGIFMKKVIQLKNKAFLAILFTISKKNYRVKSKTHNQNRQNYNSLSNKLRILNL